MEPVIIVPEYFLFNVAGCNMLRAWIVLPLRQNDIKRLQNNEASPRRLRIYIEISRKSNATGGYWAFSIGNFLPTAPNTETGVYAANLDAATMREYISQGNVQPMRTSVQRDNQDVVSLECFVWS